MQFHKNFREIVNRRISQISRVIVSSSGTCVARNISVTKSALRELMQFVGIGAQVWNVFGLFVFRLFLAPYAFWHPNLPHFAYRLRVSQRRMAYSEVSQSILPTHFCVRQCSRLSFCRHPFSYSPSSNGIHT